MILKSIDIENFRGIESLSFSPQKGVTVLCGVNGSGKSTILDSISYQLSWFISRLRSNRGSGKPIKKLDIKKNKNFSRLKGFYEANNRQYSVTLVKVKPGHKSDAKSDMADFSDLAKFYKQSITQHNESCLLPLFIHYNVERAVRDIPLKIRTRHDFNLLSTYDASLDSKIAFRNFFEWFRDREDYENEKVKEMLANGEDIRIERDRELAAVRKAIENITGFKSVSIKRNPLHMQVEKEGQILWVDQLSEGEKSLFSLVGDLARRITIANPVLSNPLQGEGIVMIDEIELHLHPKWQKEIILKLSETFPNIQFILTTHSPLVLSEIESNSVYLIYQENGKIQCSPVQQSKGLSSNEILEEIMDTQPLNKQVKNHLNNIFKLIDVENISQAKKEIDDFKRQYGSVPEIVRGETLLSFYDEES